MPDPVEYSIRPGVLLTAMKDGAAVNHAALEQVKFFFPQLLDITCFSHTIDNIGKHFEFRVLDRFSQLWVSMFSHSAAVRLAWKTRTGTAMKTYSATRWWSKWEVMKQVLEYFGDVEPFLRENENDHLAPATTAKLLNIFNDASDAKELQLELAALIDGGSHFVTATYYLEGDGPLIFSCYERLASVSHSVAVDAYPNLEGVASRQANGNRALCNQLVTRTKPWASNGSSAKSFMTLSVLLKVQGYAAQSKSKTSTQMPHLWQSSESSVSSIIMQPLMALLTSFHVT